MNAIAPVEPTTLVNIVARAASDPATDVAKLQALIELQERVVRNQSKAAYMRALAKVAEALEPVKKDAVNSSFNRNYATLSAIDAAIRPIYASHGFSVSYGTAPAPEGNIGVSCTVSHEDGYSETLSLHAPLDMQTGGRARTPVQAVGSTVSYLRRYLISMAFNITTEDDDGEGSRRPTPPAPPMRQRREPPATPPEPDTPLTSWLDKYTAALEGERSLAQFMVTFRDACATASNEQDLVRLMGVDVIKRALTKGSEEVKAQMTAASSAAFKRLTPPPVPEQPGLALDAAPWEQPTGEPTDEERARA